MTQLWQWPVSVAAVVAALLYIGRKLRSLAALVTFLAGLPEEHRMLVETTKANADAIAELTELVNRLTEYGMRRRARP